MIFIYLFIYRPALHAFQEEGHEGFSERGVWCSEASQTRSQLRPIEVPKYDELSVVSLIADIMKEKDLLKFFPEQHTKTNLPDRQFFFVNELWAKELQASPFYSRMNF